jgi:hypothetical protein
VIRCRANLAHAGQSRPNFGVGVQVKVLAIFQVLTSSVRSEGSRRGWGGKKERTKTVKSESRRSQTCEEWHCADIVVNPTTSVNKGLFFRASGFGFRVWGFGSRVSCFGFRF